MERAKAKQEVRKRNSGEGEENIGCGEERKRTNHKENKTCSNIMKQYLENAMPITH